MELINTCFKAKAAISEGIAAFYGIPGMEAF